MNSSCNIAVLMTCHNRREKTLRCLKSLFAASFRPEDSFDVYLVDDGSTDGTGEAVKQDFPDINLIEGNGSLFWNQGMRLAWETASRKKNYDFYLWLNDDVVLEDFVFIEMLECFREINQYNNESAVIVGACQSSANSNEFSYGGRTDLGEVIPNGSLQPCKYINGNVVLVPNKVYEILGNLSGDYTHAMGDIDYGLRVQLAGMSCYTTKRYVGICPRNTEAPGWKNPRVPLSKRLKSVYSPNGLNLKEYIIFRKKFWGHRWVVFVIKAYLKVIFPNLYTKLLNK